MRISGDRLEGIEFGNAWQLRCPDQPWTNWFVGDHGGIDPGSLRFVGHGAAAADAPAGAAEPLSHLCVKWFQHQPDDDPAWGAAKPTSCGRTLSLLASPGAFRLRFRRAGRQLELLLEQPGDFALWGEGLEHSWRPLAPSTVISVRWRSHGAGAQGGDG